MFGEREKERNNNDNEYLPYNDIEIAVAVSYTHLDVYKRQLTHTYAGVHIIHCDKFYDQKQLFSNKH